MSLQLTVDNSYSRITGLTVAQLSELRKVLCYQSEVRWGSSFTKRSVPLIDKKGYFPSGLLNLACEWLQDKTHEVIDARIVPKPTPGMFRWQN